MMQGRDRKRCSEEEIEREEAGAGRMSRRGGGERRAKKDNLSGGETQPDNQGGLQLATQTQNAVQEKKCLHIISKSVGQLFVSFLFLPSSSKIRPYFLDCHFVH
jgi:hypothetical protein